MRTSRLLLFGDQTVDKLGAIRKLVTVSKRVPTLHRYLREAADVVQREVSALSPAEQTFFYGFDDLLALAEQNAAEETPNEICATALMCIARIGEMILYEESNPGLLMSADSTLHVLALCTGLIPATAALMSSSLTELLKYGLEMVAMSVRMGHEIFIRSQSVDKSPGSWAYSIVGATGPEVKAMLKAFHETQKIPLYKHVSLAVTSRSWTTIFGPPSTLDQLWQECPQLGLAPKLKLVAGGYVHASNLPPLNVEKILGTSDLLNAAPRPNTCCVSTSSCKPYLASDLRGLLRLMLDDIMKNTLRLTETVQRYVSDLRGCEKVDLFVVGPTAHTSMIQDSLQSAQLSVNVVRSGEAPSVVSSKREGSNLVAIVGMSGRFPGGENLQEFWNTLAQGRDLHEQIPASRFELKTHFDEAGTKRNTTSALYGCFVKDLGFFDTRMFNISPREAAQMDPMQRLLLMTTYEAMSMAGYSPGGSLSTAPARISTYIGQATDDWRSNNESSSQGIDVYYIPGVARAFHPGRLNYHFKWEGGSYNVDAACASSSTAVHLACSSLLSRECDTAIAGGANILTSPAIFVGLSRGKFLSTTGNCKAFRDDADGYCRGEGVGVVVLKRLEDALAENDNILAVINGSGRSYSADAASITQPYAPAQQKLYKHVLHKSGVDPLDIGYVEMHGTGTQAGDPVEVESVGEVFCKGRTKDNPLYVGAVKANVGHGEAAAGITSLIKTVLMLRERRIPPHPGAPFKVNSKFPSLEKMHMKIPAADIPFEVRPRSETKRRIFLNNFDASGGNTCLIVEEFPRQQRKGHDPRSFHVVTCSGRTSSSLKENQQRLLQYVKSHSGSSIRDLAYSTTARSMHHSFRVSYSIQSREHLIERLASDCNQTCKGANSEGLGAVVFVFTGQGSAYPGMGKQLFQTCSRFRESVLSYQQICDSLGLPSIVPLISDFGRSKATDPTIVQSQLAIIFVELALADLWMSWGAQPSLLMGHSLGEYSALCVSGVISVSDTFHLVGNRASILQQKCAPSIYAMLATGASQQAIEQACNNEKLGSCEISCRNAPNQTVVSGTIHDLKRLESVLGASGLRTMFLRIPYGFHSAQVEPILDEFEKIARRVHFCKPEIPIASTLRGKIVSDIGTFTSSYLARQAREPVNFIGALQACAADGIVDAQSLWFEIGPETLCLGSIRSSLSVTSDRLLATIKSSEENWKTISASISSSYLAKLAINWKAYHEEYLGALTLLELPPYAFDLKDFWSLYKQESLGPKVAQPMNVPLTASHTSALPMTTCLQYVVSESFEANSGSATFASYTSDPKLYRLIQGHLVDGVALCPASVFCDMAFTAAKHVHSKTNPNDSEAEMSLCDLQMTHPVVVSTIDVSQKVEVTATKAVSDPFVKVSFSSSSNGNSYHENGGCRVRFGRKGDWKKEFSRTLHFVRKRVDVIQSSALDGVGHRLFKPIVYKLFSNLVSYSQEYQGIEEVFLDNGCRESTARIRLRACPDAGRFTHNPYWTDNLVHLAGFVLNGDVTKPDDIAYIATGLDDLYILQELSETKEYTCYVSVEDSTEKNDTLVGDAYVFNGDTLVALCAGMCFQRMHKKILATILGKSSLTSSRSVPSQQKVATIKHDPKAPSADSTGHETISPSALKAQNDQNGDLGASESSKHGPAEDLLNLVISESGFAAEDMEPSTTFADMGVDSLMSITIISAAKSQLGLDLPASFFMNNPTVQDVRQELGGATNTDDDVSTTRSSTSNELALTESEPPSEESDLEGESVQKIDTHATSPIDIPSSPTRRPSTGPSGEPKSQEERISAPKANLVLLQGRASSTETPVFLATDGAGSATAYIHIAPLPKGRRMYALESAFLSDPLDFNCSVEEFSSLYVTAIRERQPHGPYYIGGWSAGAVYAYEISRQLLEMGEKIQCLFLIDMRVPKPMTDALEPTMELIEQAGLVTGIKRTGQLMTEASTKLKQHLVSTVKALTRFQPRPMDPARRPVKSFMVWAKQGISDGNVARMKGFDQDEINQQTAGANVMEDEKTGLKGWFFAKRTVFGPNGWDEMLGEIECHTMDADHFSMVQPPAVKVLGKLLRAAVEKAEASSSDVA